MTYLKLLLIRHAESLGNRQGQMEGQTSTALSHRGQQQAKSLAVALNEGKIAAPAYLYTSPLQRAIETAQILQTTARQVPRHQIARNLQEIDQGIFQGLTWAQAVAKYPDLCRQLTQSLAWQPVPQAESPTAARARAQQWLIELLMSHQPPDVVWAISHGGLMQQLVSEILGCDRTWKTPIHHTAIFEFWLADTRWDTLRQDRYNPEWWVLKRVNDCSHLSEFVE
ncbi:MAG: histidine phosphatase family protein [Cyanobacteria bacterium J06631_9]